MTEKEYKIRRLERTRDGYLKYAKEGFISGLGICPDSYLSEKEKEAFLNKAEEIQRRIDELTNGK